MAMWNRCAICGRAIPVGELCYGVKNWHGDPDGGDTICRDCLVPENAPTLTPPNEPLTLEQLRKMDRQPVWVKVIGKTGIRCDGWCEVEIREKDPFAYVWWPGSEVEDIAKIEDYGKTWACYAYPPAHIDREAWEPCGAYVPKIVTNADRIRAMSDEELAEWMCSLMTAECCDQRCPARDICNLGDNGLVKWMKQPAEED